MARHPTILFSVGEHSGDLHGAYLIKALKKELPDARFIGMGGPLMAAEGMSLAVNLIPHGTVGISEAVREASPILRAAKTMKTLMDTEHPDALVLIDYQGFNMMMVDHARKRGIPTIYYISPQEWIWGTKRNLRKVAQKLSLMLAVFPEEAKSYRAMGGNIRFIGHPFLDILPDLEKQASHAQLPGEAAIRMGLFPGSRAQEVDKLFPVLLGAAELLVQKIPTIYYYVPLSAQFLAPVVKKQIAASPIRNQIYLLEGVGESIRTLKGTDLNLLISGSIALEAALLEAPMLVGYKISPLSYFIGKYLLRISLPYISLPNIVLQRGVVPEFVQQQFTPELLSEAAHHLLTHPEQLATMKTKLKDVRTALGSPGVITRGAQAIAKFLKEQV